MGYYGGDIADASDRSLKAAQGINIQSVGLNLGSIMQPYTDSANNGGFGLQLKRSMLSPYGNGGSSRTYVARSSTMTAESIAKWAAIGGAALLGGIVLAKIFGRKRQ